jgi:serine/threonine-protein kinase
MEENGCNDRDADPSLDGALKAAFEDEESGQSVLARIERKSGVRSRVLLHDAPDDPSPMLRVHSLEPEGAEDDSRFQIVGEIARGGVGVVYKGRDRDLGRDVALKVLRKDHAQSREIFQRFIEEAQIGGQLQHPGIVPVYTLGLQPDGRPHFAMKLVKGRTLAALLKERKTPAQDRRRFLQVFERLCQTMAYAHARGVIHRDLKPSNILLGSFGEVLVVDWGFGKVLGRPEPQRPEGERTVIATVRSGQEGSESLTGSVMGTPAYMPPEQALGHVEELDEQSDVFSLGAILCQILTGQPPYTGAAKDLLVKASQAKLDDAYGRLDRCGADPDLLTLAKRCLAPMRADRPEHAGEVAQVMAGHLAEAERRAHEAELEAVEERGQLERANSHARWERRAKKKTRTLAAALLVAIVCGGGAYFVSDAQSRTRAEAARPQVDQAMEEATHLGGQGKWTEALAVARKASALAEDVDDDARERAQELVVRTAHGLEEAEAAARQAQKDADFLAWLEEIRLESVELLQGGADPRRIDEDYAAAFGNYGIDVEALEPDEAAGRILACGEAFAIEVATVLDDWARLRRMDRRLRGSDWQRLDAIAQRVDSDPWQTRLREAAAAGDVEGLRELARDTENRTLSVRSVVRLALELSHHRARDEAVALLRRTHRAHPDDLWVNRYLARCLVRLKPPRWEEAFRHLHAAIALRPRSASLRWGLGSYHHQRREIDEAFAAYRDSIRLQPTYWAHINLGHLLRHRRLVDEAIESYREAIRLQPDGAVAHQSLGLALFEKGRYDEAIDAYRASIRFKPGYAYAHNSLAVALEKKGVIDEAIAAYREAIRVKPNYGEAHANLATTYYEQGRFREALDSMREARECGGQREIIRDRRSAQKGGFERYTTKWVRKLERLVRLDEKLPEVLAGESVPADARERLGYAEVCFCRKLYAAAASFWLGAFVEEPSATEDLFRCHRYNAACAAALASCGEGEDAGDLDHEARARWRTQALTWLRAALALRREQARGRDFPGAWSATRALEHWRRDDGLVGVRDEIDDLPHEEQKQWRDLWREVDEFLAKLKGGNDAR